MGQSEASTASGRQVGRWQQGHHQRKRGEGEPVPSPPGAVGGAPPNDCLCPPFRFSQHAFLKHPVTTRQQATMEKGIVVYKAQT